MAYTVLDNTPSAGCIQWSGIHMVYNGVTYTIANGYTNYIYTYWTLANPNNFIVSNTFPMLGPDDAIVFLNKLGTHLTVPGATILDGDLIVPGSILASAIAANTITASQIAADTITGTQIAAGAITASELAVGAVTATSIAANAVGANAIAATSITGSKLVAGTITGDKIAAATITANNLVAGTITAASGIIANAAIGSAQIADASITSAKIASLDAGKITTGTLNGISITGSTITAIDNFTVQQVSTTSASITIGNGAGGVTPATITYSGTDVPLGDVVLEIASVSNIALEAAPSGYVSVPNSLFVAGKGIDSSGGNVVAPAFDGMLRIPTLSTGAQLNDSVRLSVLYCGSSNGSFAGNFTANVQYPVHNGGTSPVYCAQTMSFTKPTRILITGVCSFLASSTTFTGMTYIRISLRAGSSYVGATVIATGGAAGENHNANFGWHQMAFSTVLSVPAGGSTWWLEWWSNTGNPYQMTGNLWNITTMVLAQ